MQNLLTKKSQTPASDQEKNDVRSLMGQVQDGQTSENPLLQLVAMPIPSSTSGTLQSLHVAARSMIPPLQRTHAAFQSARRIADRLNHTVSEQAADSENTAKSAAQHFSNAAEDLSMSSWLRERQRVNGTPFLGDLLAMTKAGTNASNEARAGGGLLLPAASNLFAVAATQKADNPESAARIIVSPRPFQSSRRLQPPESSPPYLRMGGSRRFWRRAGRVCARTEH